MNPFSTRPAELLCNSLETARRITIRSKPYLDRPRQRRAPDRVGFRPNCDADHGSGGDSVSAGKLTIIHTGEGTSYITSAYALLLGSSWYIWTNTGDKVVVRAEPI